MDIKAKWTALGGLDIENRIAHALRDDEPNPELDCATRTAKDIAHEAFRAGYAQAMRELKIMADRLRTEREPIGNPARCDKTCPKCGGRCVYDETHPEECRSKRGCLWRYGDSMGCNKKVAKAS